jgi:hypothetical protein
MKPLLEALALGVPFFAWTLWLLRKKASKTWTESCEGFSDSTETVRGRANALASKQPNAPRRELPPNDEAGSE